MQNTRACNNPCVLHVKHDAKSRRCPPLIGGATPLMPVNIALNNMQDCRGAAVAPVGVTMKMLCRGVSFFRAT